MSSETEPSDTPQTDPISIADRVRELAEGRKEAAAAQDLAVVTGRREQLEESFERLSEQLQKTHQATTEFERYRIEVDTEIEVVKGLLAELNPSLAEATTEGVLSSNEFQSDDALRKFTEHYNQLRAAVAAEQAALAQLAIELQQLHKDFVNTNTPAELHGQLEAQTARDRQQHKELRAETLEGKAEQQLLRDITQRHDEDVRHFGALAIVEHRAQRLLIQPEDFRALAPLGQEAALQLLKQFYQLHLNIDFRDQRYAIDAETAQRERRSILQPPGTIEERRALASRLLDAHLAQDWAEQALRRFTQEHEDVWQASRREEQRSKLRQIADTALGDVESVRSSLTPEDLDHTIALETSWSGITLSIKDIENRRDQLTAQREESKKEEDRLTSFLNQKKSTTPSFFGKANWRRDVTNLEQQIAGLKTSQEQQTEQIVALHNQAQPLIKKLRTAFQHNKILTSNELAGLELPQTGPVNELLDRFEQKLNQVIAANQSDPTDGALFSDFQRLQEAQRSAVATYQKLLQENGLV